MTNPHDASPGDPPADDAPLTGGDRHNRLASRRLGGRPLLTRPDEPLRWRCDRLAADGFVTVLTGEGGEGKSFLTLALAKAVAEGSAAAGIDCTPGRALIFDAE